MGTSAGALNLYSVNAGTSLSTTVNNLPADGSTVYVRLWTLASGTWVYNDYTYTAISQAAMTSPANGSTLSGASVTFHWSAGTGTQNTLYVGTSVGALDLYSVNAGAGVSATVPNLPTNGSTVYVRLWTLASGIWVYHDYTYTAFNSMSQLSTSESAEHSLH